jgi:hypothetical protein
LCWGVAEVRSAVTWCSAATLNSALACWVTVVRTILAIWIYGTAWSVLKACRGGTIEALRAGNNVRTSRANVIGWITGVCPAFWTIGAGLRFTLAWRLVAVLCQVWAFGVFRALRLILYTDSAVIVTRKARGAGNSVGTSRTNAIGWITGVCSAFWTIGAGLRFALSYRLVAVLCKVCAFGVFRAFRFVFNADATVVVARISRLTGGGCLVTITAYSSSFTFLYYTVKSSSA